jgi:drug/metabolite transporter (DMT)-like permease
MLKPLLFAALAAFGNALFVYGQRGTTPPANPFLFVLGAVAVCTVMFAVAAMLYRVGDEVAYFAGHWKWVLISGTGFFLTFVGFFLLYTNFGASQYTLYAVISILTTSLGVGVLVYREHFNMYHAAAMVLAIAAIALFTYGNGRNVA